jgi:hypothetical protein
MKRQAIYNACGANSISGRRLISKLLIRAERRRRRQKQQQQHAAGAY